MSTSIQWGCERELWKCSGAASPRLRVQPSAISHFSYRGRLWKMARSWPGAPWRKSQLNNHCKLHDEIVTDDMKEVKCLNCMDGSIHEYDECIWCTQGSAQGPFVICKAWALWLELTTFFFSFCPKLKKKGWIKDSGFETDEHGFLLVDTHLQSVNTRNVFGCVNANLFLLLSYWFSLSLLRLIQQL